MGFIAERKQLRNTLASWKITGNNLPEERQGKKKKK